MYARIATFAGQGRLDEAIEANRREVESAVTSPPPGLEGIREVWMLVDRDAGTTMDVMLFETLDELRRGDEMLNAASPADAEGHRTSVGLYEVAFRVERN